MNHAIDHALLQRIWDAHHLGFISRVEQPARGIVNHCLIVNDADVIRLDALGDDDLPTRYLSEQMAYERLRDSGVPVPDVRILDTSQTLVPCDYVILSKLPGETVIDSWQELSLDQQNAIAYSAGKYLATIHSQTFGRFGRLNRLAQGGFARWVDYVDDLFRCFCAEAAACQVLDSDTLERMQRAVASCRPLLEAVTTGALVQGDYHFENLLQAGGVISGVIDFEWALSGDPSWDFKVEDQWEDTCPGSRAQVYAGYTEVRGLDEHHPARAALYTMLMFLDDVILSKEDPTWGSYEQSLQKMLTALERVECLREKAR